MLIKKTGITYVYEAVSYWDKEKKRPSNKQICVGKLDKDACAFIPSKRIDDKQAAARDSEVTAGIQIIWPSLLLNKITIELGIDKILKKCTSDTYLQVLTMAYFLVTKGDALSHCESWSKTHSNPINSILSS